jgi:hypothetical protein
VSSRSGIDKRRHSRHARRIPCQLFVGEREHSALVLDLSVSGLFIQTHARPLIGERLRVQLAHDRVPLELTVEVARAKSVPPALLTAAKGGIGVRLVSAPAEYDKLLARLGIGEAPEPESFEVEIEPGPRFRVYVAQRGGSRSRRVEVKASDPDEAAERAIEELGSEWKVLRVQPV